MISQPEPSITPFAWAERPAAIKHAEAASEPLQRHALLGLPAAAWSRVLVLFIALASIKLVLLAGLNKHLFEIHWRVAGQPVSWLNDVAFYSFVLLGVASLAFLGKRCRSAGLGAVRIANAAILFLGLIFIFLSFHAGERNYLYPVMTGVLKWSSLWPYLSLDLFFRAPFLAAWIFGYGLLYYLMARTGRETLAVYLTAFCAGAYALVSLRELRFYRHELLVADCLGLTCLLCTRRSARSFQPTWLLLPVMWAVLFWSLLTLASSPLRELDPYFRLLLGETIVLFGAATIVAWKKGFYQAWLTLAPFLACAFLLFTNTNYPAAKNYNNALCLALEFPRYFVEEVLLCAAVLLGAGLASRLWPKARFWWLDILSLALVVLAMVDLRITQIMGVRLEWNVVTFGDSPVMMWRMAKPYLPGLLGGFGAMLLLYLLAVRAFQLWFHFAPPGGPAGGHSCSQQTSHRLWSAAPRTFSYFSRLLRTRMSGRRTNLEKSWTIFVTNTGCWFALGSFVLLGLLGWAVAQPDKAEGESGFRLVLSSPLWNRVANRTLSSQEFLATAKSLGLDNFENASSVPLTSARDVNVLLVFLESSYNKYLSLFGSAEETQPLLSKYKDRMEIFPNFFSDFAGSIHARFATFTSLYPVRDYNAFTMRRVNVKSVFEVLHEHGYACSMFYSSFFDYTGFGDFLKGRGLDEMYDANTMPGQHAAERVTWGLREDATLAAIRSQIKKYALADRRFFLTYVPAAPHYPYDNIPKEFCRFKKTPMGDYTSAYLNELLYMDFILASIVDQLKESGLLDKTMVVITNDHGEMLGNEGNPIGHGSDFTPELGNTPLIIMDPQNPGNHVNYTIGSQVDLLPTLLARLNLPTPAGQLYEGRSLDATGTPNARRIYLNTLQQFGVLAGNQIFVGERRTGGASSTASGRIFGIANEGTKTLFTEVHSAPGNGISIKPFDDFQENLLHNYSFYSDALTKGKSAVNRQGLSSQ